MKVWACVNHQGDVQLSTASDTKQQAMAAMVEQFSMPWTAHESAGYKAICLEIRSPVRLRGWINGKHFGDGAH